MSSGSPDLASRKGDYGFDAPLVPIVLVASGVGLLVIALLSATLWGSGGWFLFPLLAGLFMLVNGAVYIFTTRAEKFAIWAGLLRGLDVRGDERILDMGSGRGAVLLMAAKLLPRGRAVGVDRWKSSDQSGNTVDAARRNAERESVGDRVDLRTGDMTRMPVDDGSFDVVLSALAIHNIKDPQARRRAIDEAARVLRPGGSLVISDIQTTPQYADRLRELGLQDVRRHGLGWRYWYGGPWMATCHQEQAQGSPRWRSRTMVAPPSGSKVTSTVLDPGGRVPSPSQPQVKTSRRGRSTLHELFPDGHRGPHLNPVDASRPWLELG